MIIYYLSLSKNHGRQIKNFGSVVKRLRHRPFTAVTRVGLQHQYPPVQIRSTPLFSRKQMVSGIFLFQNYFKKATGSVCFGSFFENIIFLIFFFFHIVFVHIRRFSLIRNLVPSVLFSEHFHFFPCRQSSDNLACADVGFCTYIDR